VCNLHSLFYNGFSFLKKIVKNFIKYTSKLNFFHCQMIRTCISISKAKACLTMPHPSQKPKQNHGEVNLKFKMGSSFIP